MPWEAKILPTPEWGFGAYTLRARHRGRFDVGFFIALRGPPQTPIGAKHNGRTRKTT